MTSGLETELVYSQRIDKREVNKKGKYKQQKNEELRKPKGSK